MNQSERRRYLIQYLLMYLRNLTRKFTPGFSEQIERLQTALREADAVVIGAGAGLSAFAGFPYSGERFEKYFSDFRQKYGFQDMYSGGFYPYPALEEHCRCPRRRRRSTDEDGF